MNTRNTWIRDIIKIKYNNDESVKNKLKCKSNAELYEIWKTIRCELEAEELLEEFEKELLYEEFNMFRF